jgi:hypothetical protein
MARRRRVGRAVLALQDAPESACPHCGRVTKTTSDGVCADCWGSKGGSMLARPPQQPGRATRFLLRLLGPRR